MCPILVSPGIIFSSSFKCFSKKLKVKLFNIYPHLRFFLLQCLLFISENVEPVFVVRVRVCEWDIEYVCVSLNAYTIEMCLYLYSLYILWCVCTDCVPFHMLLPISRVQAFIMHFPLYPGTKYTIFLIRWIWRTHTPKNVQSKAKLYVLSWLRLAHKEQKRTQQFLYSRIE